jgi:hypothetical protein
MLTISKPVGRGRNGDEDMVGKDSGLLIALVCDRTFQSIILLQISSSFFTKSAEEPNLRTIFKPTEAKCGATRQTLLPVTTMLRHTAKFGGERQTSLFLEMRVVRMFASWPLLVHTARLFLEKTEEQERKRNQEEEIRRARDDHRRKSPSIPSDPALNFSVQA